MSRDVSVKIVRAFVVVGKGNSNLAVIAADRAHRRPLHPALLCLALTYLLVHSMPLLRTKLAPAAEVPSRIVVLQVFLRLMDGGSRYSILVRLPRRVAALPICEESVEAISPLLPDPRQRGCPVYCSMLRCGRMEAQRRRELWISGLLVRAVCPSSFLWLRLRRRSLRAHAKPTGWYRRRRRAKLCRCNQTRSEWKRGQWTKTCAP